MFREIKRRYQVYHKGGSMKIVVVEFVLLLLLLLLSLRNSYPTTTDPAPELTKFTGNPYGKNKEIIELEVVWWNFLPYTTLVNNSQRNEFQNDSLAFQFDGVFRSILQTMLRSCSEAHGLDLSIRNSTCLDNPQQFMLELDISKSANKSRTLLLLPYSRELSLRLSQDHTEYFFLPLIVSPGAMHFYKRQADPVGSDLLTVIVQGWPLLILIMLGAAYSGIIVWLLDRLWNPDNFPRPFIRGFWEGFWWAFVTMTTVGYGDTTPRSIQARVFGLMWIIVGITILSVFTATVTTVLTKESLGTLRHLQGRHLGIIKGSEDHKLAISVGAKPAGVNSVDDLVSSVVKERVEGALLDAYAFAESQHALDPQILVDGLVDNHRAHGVFVQGGSTSFNQCLKTYASINRNNFFAQLAQYVRPLSSENYKTAAENAQELFQPKTIVLMWYGLLVWIVIFVGFVIWEFAYWRPKHKQRQQEKEEAALEKRGQIEEMSGSKPKKTIQTQTSLIHDENTNKNSKTSKSKDTKSSEKIPYTNHGFDTETESNASSGVESGGPGEYRGLAYIIKRQNKELYELEEEYLAYQQEWELRVNMAQKRHRREQMDYLRALHKRANNTEQNDVSNKGQGLRAPSPAKSAYSDMEGHTNSGKYGSFQKISKDRHEKNERTSTKVNRRHNHQPRKSYEHIYTAHPADPF